MTALPVSTTFVDGVVVTANGTGNALNPYLRDPINFLLTPPICQLYHSVATQSIPNNAFTPVLFDSEYVDNTGMHSTVTNTSRCTAVYPGWYDVCGLGSTAGNATGSRGEQIRVNGVAINGTITTRPSNANATTGITPSALVYLNVGDYVELAVYQNSGGALAMGGAGLSPSLSVKWKSS